MPRLSLDRSSPRSGNPIPTPGNGNSLRGMEALIPVVNKLREVFDRTGLSSKAIQLPQIVVVGCQSSGKSSVLESLVGKPFLPRGSGIVTRCPIVLNLVNVQDDEPEWCEFQHKEGKFTIEQVEHEIRCRTDAIAGRNQGITSEKITLTVYSPNVLTLTVVDLPGLVKIPTGAQPENIEEQVENLVLAYASQSNAVILAVSPGNADIATSDSIKLAKKVDPLQERTLGVITKLDLADDISDVLTGRTLPMKLGIIGVVNRSQRDLEMGVTHEEALEKERKILSVKYPDLASQHGTRVLALRLNQILLQHITKCCPSLDMRVKQLLSEKKEQLTALGKGDDMSEAEKAKEMSTILDKFAKTYKAQVDGQGRTELVTDTLTCGARIDYILDSTFVTDMELLDPLQSITYMDIIKAMRNTKGIGMRLSQPEVVLHHLLKKEILKMKPIATHCASLVYQEMIDMIQACIEPNDRFPKVNDAISQVVQDILNRRIESVKEILENYVDVQAVSGLTFDRSYHEQMQELMGKINSMDLGNVPMTKIIREGEFCDSMLRLSDGRSVPVNFDPSLTADQIKFCEDIQKLVMTYFVLVKKQVMDYVPKSLQHSMIFHVVDHMNTELMAKLFNEETIECLIREPEHVAEIRKTLELETEGLSEASKLLDEVRKTTIVQQ